MRNKDYKYLGVLALFFGILCTSLTFANVTQYVSIDVDGSLGEDPAQALNASIESEETTPSDTQNTTPSDTQNTTPSDISENNENNLEKTTSSDTELATSSELGNETGGSTPNANDGTSNQEPEPNEPSEINNEPDGNGNQPNNEGSVTIPYSVYASSNVSYGGVSIDGNILSIHDLIFVSNDGYLVFELNVNNGTSEDVSINNPSLLSYNASNELNDVNAKLCESCDVNDCSYSSYLVVEANNSVNLYVLIEPNGSWINEEHESFDISITLY